MFQIVRLLLRANTLVLCHLLVGSVLPSLSSCVLLRAVCCAVTRKFSNYLLVLLCLGVCIFFVTRFQSKLCDEICFTKNNKHPVYLWQCAASTCLLFWFNFLSTALASRSVEGVVGSQLFLGSRPTQSTLFPTRVFREKLKRGVEKAPELQRARR